MAETPYPPRQAYMGLRDPDSAFTLSWQVLPATFLIYKKYILKFAKKVLQTEPLSYIPIGRHVDFKSIFKMFFLP